MRVRLPHKSKLDNYTESYRIDAADRWRKRNVWVSAPLQSVQYKRPLDVLYPREVCTESSERSNRCCKTTLNVQKSAEVIVAVLFSVKDRINRSL